MIDHGITCHMSCYFHTGTWHHWVIGYTPYFVNVLVQRYISFKHYPQLLESQEDQEWKDRLRFLSFLISFILHPIIWLNWQSLYLPWINDSTFYE